MTPKFPEGGFFKQLIFSGLPLGLKGKNDNNQQSEGILDRTHRCKDKFFFKYSVKEIIL